MDFEMGPISLYVVLGIILSGIVGFFIGYSINGSPVTNLISGGSPQQLVDIWFGDMKS